MKLHRIADERAEEDRADKMARDETGRTMSSIRVTAAFTLVDFALSIPRESFSLSSLMNVPSNFS